MRTDHLETDQSTVQSAGSSGNISDREERVLEQLVFGRRPILLFVFGLLTLFFGYQASLLRPDASFEKMIPRQHPFIQNMFRHIADLGASGTTIQVTVENTNGDIFDPDYLEVLRQVSDEVFYLDGVDRNRLQSLWTPNVRWTEVTAAGFEGGVVIPDDYDGSAISLESLRQNILRSGQVGRLVADNFRSSVVEAPIFDRDPISGEALDYQKLSRQLEEQVRQRFEKGNIRIRITGFAKMVGDLIDGISSIAVFAVITLVITAIILFFYTRCVAATIAPLACSLTAVVWQLGLLHSLGYGLNAYSILVPFLVFAIGVSHGVQIVNAIAVESLAGNSRIDAAKLAFRALYIAGMAALMSDAVGFLTLMLIDIEVIQDLGIAASIGVAVIVLTNLVLLPVIMSYLGMCARGQAQAERRHSGRAWLWELMSYCAERRIAVLVLLLAGVGFALGFWGSTRLQVGDLDPGAPELHPDSRYNLDTLFVTSNYATSADVLVVLVETEPEQCYLYDNLVLIDQFTWTMHNVPGVQSALSLAEVTRQVMMAFNEGSLKWAALSRNQRAMDTTFSNVPSQLVNRDCSLAPVILFLDDHRASTLERVVNAVEKFAAGHDSERIRFRLGAGNAGVEAATNQEISKAQMQILILVYTVVGALVFLSFRSLTTVICIMVPLGLTSALCSALMAQLGIGIKVATLPVIALGVGVGVDYGIYIYNKLRHFLERGMQLRDAYFHTLRSTGAAVSLTGLALAVGVGTWIWSPIKFQADMGKLLTFMFLFNMLGALLLLPALASFLLAPARQADPEAVESAEL